MGFASKVILLVVAFLVFLVPVSTLVLEKEAEDFFARVRATGPESESEIVSDFLKTLEETEFEGLTELREKYETFRKVWHENMIEKIIEQLDITE